MIDYDDRIAARNRVNLARWAERWYKRGGTMTSDARDYPDPRNDDERERWRAMETELRAHYRAITLKKWQRHLALVHAERKQKVVSIGVVRRARTNPS